MKFYIWSQEHEAWWKPGGMGYTRRRLLAGRFTIEEALNFRLDSCEGDIPQGADLLVPVNE